MSAAGYVKCPFCAEDIRAEAKMCRYCREFVDRPSPKALAAIQAQKEAVRAPVKEAVVARPAEEVVAPRPSWETCEIRVEQGDYQMIPDTHDWRLWAEAVGPVGRYTAAVSQRSFRSKGANYRPFASLDGSKCLDELIADLTGQGWQPLPTQREKWYEYKFQRTWDERRYAAALARVAEIQAENSKSAGTSLAGCPLLILAMVFVGALTSRIILGLVKNAAR